MIAHYSSVTSPRFTIAPFKERGLNHERSEHGILERWLSQKSVPPLAQTLQINGLCEVRE